MNLTLGGYVGWFVGTVAALMVQIETWILVVICFGLGIRRHSYLWVPPLVVVFTAAMTALLFEQWRMLGVLRGWESRTACQLVCYLFIGTCFYWLARAFAPKPKVS